MPQFNKFHTQNLEFYFGKKKIISNINYTFEEGKLYGILGPNGAGKSTLLKLLAAIWKPTSGNVFFNEDNLHSQKRLEISKIVTVVPQATHIPFEFSAYEFVAMGRYAHSNSKLQTYDKEIIERFLQLMDVWDFRKRRMNEISHGERQRCYIARALVTESAILLLDEPTANLDIKHQLEIWHCLKQLVNQGKIVIVTSHDLIATKQFCDHIAIIYQGISYGMGTFSEILEIEILEKVFGVTLKNDKYSLKFLEN